MAEPKTETQLSAARARLLAIAAQGLGGAPKDELIPTLERTGFVRTLGGADVYVAVRARVPGLRRCDLDAAVAAGGARVLPAARGCIYLVAGRHAALALRLADLLSRRRAEREQERAGIEAGELERLGEQVVEALAGGPLDTHALRRRLPEGAVRSLGAGGKKVGLSSTLPPALRRLEFAGRLERRLEGGRLDTERYLWALPQGDPLAAAPDGEAALHAEVARLFFTAAGLATRRAFAAWSGLSQAATKTAVAALGLVPVAVEGESERYWASAEALAAPEPAAREAVAFLPFEDSLLAFQGGPAFFVDPEHRGLPVPVWGRGKGTTLGDVRHSTLRPIVAEGRSVGFWEYDPDEGRVVTAVFDRITRATRGLVEARAEDLGAFLAEDLGHGRSFSLDTDDSLRGRVAQLLELTA